MQCKQSSRDKIYLTLTIYNGKKETKKKVEKVERMNDRENERK